MNKVRAEVGSGVEAEVRIIGVEPEVGHGMRLEVRGGVIACVWLVTLPGLGSQVHINW